MDFNDCLLQALSITDKTAENFHRAGIKNLRDLLFHLPIRYEDRSQITPIADLREGISAQIIAEVVSVDLIRRHKPILVVTVGDTTGSTCQIIYYHFYSGQQKAFIVGRRGVFYGKVTRTMTGYQISHPEISWLSANEIPDLPKTLSAIYATVKGLNQRLWRSAVAKALKLVAAESRQTDPFHAEGMMSFTQALYSLHQPHETDSNQTSLLSEKHPARQRLIIEELCAHQLFLQAAREKIRILPAIALQDKQSLIQEFIARLPFDLTQAQQKVFSEIRADLGKKQPMMRLVQGDVGSGKTIIALLACLQAVSAGKQAVFMVPTELLAEQHYDNISRLLCELPVHIVMLVSKMGAAKKRAVLHAIATGSAQIIVGTHALFQQQVQYANLALIVIDEQHRFGVHQRLQLQNKAVSAATAHQLILTATPIPRTLAMSHYGELDTSIIDALPGGRKPIHTAVINNTKRDAVVTRVGAVCRQGHQAYWVCPLIEESDTLECENAENIALQLQKQLPDIKIALLHGRIPDKIRRETMNAFANGEVQLLVATTVIEVGVDVPNATLMIIENAERFGLAQLHQLRGRVGRGKEQSYCLLLYQAPLSTVARHRLHTMRETNDGFRIAEEDLAIRGAGELLGTRQTGEAFFRVAQLPRDEDLLLYVNQLVETIQYKNPQFAQILLNRWLGTCTQYLHV